MKKKLTLLRKGCLTAALIFIAAIVGLYLVVSVFPSVGAQGADVLRKIIGDQAVAQLEMFAFQISDSVKSVKYSLGIEKPAAPWQVATSTPAAQAIVPTATPTPLPVVTLAPTQTPVHTSTPAPTFTPTPTPWRLQAISPFSSLAGEGEWLPYIQDVDGSALSYRTFLQPDPKRPYTVVGVVAFDLTRTRLNFMLGWEEPKASDAPKRPMSFSKIPESDFKAGVLLATFNGGFKGEHGRYGAMAADTVALPPRDGMATVAMYKNGDVRIGEWNVDIKESPEIIAWRQNCHLIIKDGEINPLTNVDSAEYWGANLNGATVTWRSGIGISKDGKTLFYFAGPNMTMPILAQAMSAAGAYQALQLDINNYWVHFTAVRLQGDKLIADPLYPVDMKEQVDRFLLNYPRDFFYISRRQN